MFRGHPILFSSDFEHLLGHESFQFIDTLNVISGFGFINSTLETYVKVNQIQTKEKRVQLNSCLQIADENGHFILHCIQKTLLNKKWRMERNQL